MSGLGDRRLDVPAGLVARMAGRPAEPGVSGDAWLAELPRLVEAALGRWELTVDGPSLHGYCALVLPVRRGGEPLMLKLGWPHAESRHEHLALRAWAGRGAVRLVAAHPADEALLLQRLDPTRDLYSADADTACVVIGELLARLDVPSLPQLDRLSDWTAAFLADTADVRAVAAAGLPRRFVEQARSVARDLAGDGGLDARLVHADLHDGNVLPDEAGRWLAIDPKPLAAEPAYALAPHLWNRWPEARASGDPARHVNGRLLALAEAAGVQESRARAWTLVRLVATASWRAATGDPDGGPTPMSGLIAIMKAVASNW